LKVYCSGHRGIGYEARRRRRRRGRERRGGLEAQGRERRGLASPALGWIAGTGNLRSVLKGLYPIYILCESIGRRKIGRRMINFGRR